MSKKSHKIIKRIVLVVLVLVIAITAVNWYLKYRLEQYLRGTLSEKVTEASNGLYRFDFDDLSIGIISGELRIEGINLRPDSAILHDTLFADKKLEQYLDLKIGSIYFKGVNLTWRTDYKKLHFDLFEVKNAVINIYNNEASQTKESNQPIGKVNVYEMISPYINVLNVNKIRLESSSVNYRYYDEDGMLSRYALDDINFEANNFLLDQNAEALGRLLYCDNFNFRVNKPQRLISNGQFSLRTSQMVLDTKDSIIQIKDVQLIPKRRLWNRMKQLPDSYLQGSIDSINVKGLYITRNEGKSAFMAGSFDINHPNIEYFAIAKDSLQSQTNDAGADSLDLSWSLYTVISPLLSKVAINSIDVNDAKFKYSQCLAKDTNVYTLDTLNLVAINFVVDSLSEFALQKRFLYSDGFGLKADGIKGINVEKNVIVSARSMMINTIDKSFAMKDIAIQPISKQTKDDYIVGKLRRISIDDLEYDKGLEANVLRIEQPEMEYVRVSSVKEYENKNKEKVRVDDGNNLWQQVSPFFNHLLVKRIELSDGLLHYTDMLNNNRYGLYGLYFHASNLLVDQKTIDTSGYMSAFEQLELGFDWFDGVWASGQHRINTERVSYSTRSQNLRIEKLRLMPLVSPSQAKVASLLDVSLPLINFSGLQFMFSGFNLKDFRAKTLDIVSPHITISELGASKETNVISPNEVEQTNIESLIQKIDLTQLNVSDAQINYVSKRTNDTLHTQIEKLELDQLSWNMGSAINLKRMLLISPLVRSASNSLAQQKTNKNKRQTSTSFFDSPIYKSINIETLDIQNAHLALDDRQRKVQLSLPSFAFYNLKWNKTALDLNAIRLQKPWIEMVQYPMPASSTVEAKHSAPKSNIYQELRAISNSINIGSVDVLDASLDYLFYSDDAPSKKHHLNETNVMLRGLKVDNLTQKYDIGSVELNVRNFHYPSQNGFYSFRVGDIRFSSKAKSLLLDSIALIPAYPKMEFAYKDPRHTDWFDVRVGSVKLLDIDLPNYIENNRLFADSLLVDYVLLQNFKNQNIDIEHNIMPMIYAGLQDLPLKMSINRASVKNFNVIYEELPKKAEVPMKIVFNNMNGRLRGLTNIATSPNQFIELLADGRFMNTGNFKARWMIPVSKNYDCFEIDASMHHFSLTDLNPIIEPMAPVRVNDGIVKEVSFNIEGSSLGADVQMLMLYNDLDVIVQKGMDNSNTNTFLTKVTNAIIRSNNPNKPKSKPRQPDLYVVRDPYHSTFNYLWQILQPPLVESVGISQGKQNFAKKVSGIISSIKNFFKRDKKKIEKAIEIELEQEQD